MNQSNNIFDSFYSKYYDLIYQKKNYRKECDRIESFIKSKKTIKILDIGCGTCNHSIEFAKRGYHCCGIDNSKQMLAIAKEKIYKKKIKNIKLIRANAENLDIDRKTKFDLVLLLFNVIGYIENIDRFFLNIKNYLNDNALLIFDFWHESALEYESPGKTIKKFSHQNLQFKKISSGQLNKEESSVKIEIITSLKKNGKLIAENKENHNVKYYNLNMLKNTIEKNGLKLVKFEDFANKGKKPNKYNWNAYCIAKI